jgi:hypothetical protein
LRKAGKLSVSLVGDDRGAVIGHIAASPVSVSDGASEWYGIVFPDDSVSRIQPAGRSLLSCIIRCNGLVCRCRAFAGKGFRCGLPAGNNVDGVGRALSPRSNS